MSDDFADFARTHLQFRDKTGETRAFVPNSVQRFIHEQLEAQRAATGRVRAIILKSRQQGVSTYVLARYAWRRTQEPNFRAWSVVHLDTMAEHMRGILGRFGGVSPDRHLVSVAGAWGRLALTDLMHGSECGYWPGGSDGIHRICWPAIDGSEIILEGTAGDQNGGWREMCVEAGRGHSPFSLIFVPWFRLNWLRLPDAEGFQPTRDEAALADEHGLSLGQLAWRRMRIDEMGGVERFRRYYPSTVDEALLSATGIGG